MNTLQLNLSSLGFKLYHARLTRQGNRIGGLYYIRISANNFSLLNSIALISYKEDSSNFLENICQRRLFRKIAKKINVRFSQNLTTGRNWVETLATVSKLIPVSATKRC